MPAAVVVDVLQDLHRIDEPRAVPLYRAVEVREVLPDHQIRRLHSTLRESGLLDALVVDPENEAEVAERLGSDAGDRWIRPRPLPDGTPTLEDVLEPAPCGVPEAAVTAALRSVALREDADARTAAVGANGIWSVGLLHGWIPEPADDTPVYVGQASRVRERDTRPKRRGSAPSPAIRKS